MENATNRDSAAPTCYTPGPWQLWLHPRGAFSVKSRGDYDESFMIASRNAFAEMAEEMHANARLISAAPDLLIACKVALTSLRHSGIVGSSPETDVIEAAISKATRGV